MSESEIDPHRAQILRQQLGRVLRGKQIQDVVGGIEMLIVDVLSSLPGLSEADMLSSFDAMASDVRNIIRERYATQGRPN